MKTIIITTDGPEQRYVTKCLVNALGHHLSGIVIEQSVTKKSPIGSLKKAAKKYGKSTVVESIINKDLQKDF